MRRRREIIRLEIPASTDAVIQARVAPLLPNGVHVYIASNMVDAIVRAAYIQGAMDALLISERHPEILETTLRSVSLEGL